MKQSSEDLATFASNNVGVVGSEARFDYADLLGDVDGYLFCKFGGFGSDSARRVLKASESERLRLFYAERFGSSVSNAASASVGLLGGLFPFLGSLDVSISAFRIAAGLDDGDPMPNANECAVLGSALGEVLKNG